jgi:hypothetical protein
MDVKALVHEVLGNGDETILEYLCGVLDDEDFDWHDGYESIGPILVRLSHHNRQGAAAAARRAPLGRVRAWTARAAPLLRRLRARPARVPPTRGAPNAKGLLFKRHAAPLQGPGAARVGAGREQTGAARRPSAPAHPSPGGLRMLRQRRRCPGSVGEAGLQAGWV